MSKAQHFYDGVVDAVFNENATLVDLLKVVSLLAILIFALFSLFRPVLTSLANGPLKKTMWKVVDIEFNRPDKIEWQEVFGVTTKQEYYDRFVIGFWPDLMLIAIQHILGGLFAVPAVLGVGSFSTSVRSSLACLGIMTEMGWEIQDLCTMYFYRIFLGKEGEKKYPNVYVVLLSLHHSLTCVMGLPVILRYRDLPEVHRLVFDLQFAGGLMLLFGEITRPLDVTKKNELRIFVFISTLMLLLTAWTRVFDWFYLLYKILARFIADENWTFLVVGSCIFMAFSMFNIFACVIPTYQRFVKFIKKLNEYESLPRDASASRRRTTVYELQLAAAEFTALETRFDETLLNLFVDRQVKRRHTLNSAALSRSAAMAAASSRVSSRKLRPHRQSMVAWRSMPSRVKQKVEDIKID
mmetsp:Transcript_1729/g.4043  ORF Transcript_1729/g.4043 Transcript_1729/m.4043 type:complete len:410 (-) Transcript_1729:421-1650(-)